MEVYNGNKSPVIKIDNRIMKNKKIVIIGGSSGIGLNLAKHLLKLGAQVLIASRKENNLKKAKVELGDKIEIHVLEHGFYVHAELIHKVFHGITKLPPLEIVSAA